MLSSGQPSNESTTVHVQGGETYILVPTVCWRGLLGHGGIGIYIQGCLKPKSIAQAL